MRFQPVRPFALTQYLRIFVIVHLTSFLITRTALESYKYTAPPLPSQVVTRKQPAPLSERGESAQTQERAGAMPKPKTENTKKVAGNAKKAEAAAQKQAVKDAAVAHEEDEKWSKGSKGSSKKDATEDKKAAAAAAKAERDKLLAAEEEGQPSKAKGAGKKVAEKKTRGTLDLSQLEGDSTKEQTLNASGIDNALDALTLTGANNNMKMDRHPERRFAAAYKQYEEKRLPQMKEEHPGLRRNQQVELIRKEFEKHPDNPFNADTNVRFDASRDDIADAQKRVKDGVEKRLGEK